MKTTRGGKTHSTSCWRDQRELFPFAMTGPELDTYVKKQVADYKTLAQEFGLIQ